MIPRKCQYKHCGNVALVGSPEAADAIDARNCALCDHGECNALSGFTTQYRGPVPALYVAPQAAVAPAAPVAAVAAVQCQCCDRTAMRGTPAAERAVDPDNCPRCDHNYAVALAGGPLDFRGVDTPVFAPVAPLAPPRAPTTAQLTRALGLPTAHPSSCLCMECLATVPEVWLPCELGYVPEIPEAFDAPGLARCEPAAPLAATEVA